MVSSTCFEHPNVHQQAVWSTYCHRPDCYTDAWKQYHKTACTSLPEVEHLNVRNMSKTL